MLKKSYLVIGSIIFCLLFSFNTVFAASTTTVSSSGTTGDNDTLNVRAYSYNDYAFTDQTETETGYTMTWDINQTFDIYALTKGYYYTGVVSFRADISTNYTTSRTTPIMITNVTDGIYAFISAQTSTGFTIDVVFDNYYAASTWVGLPTVEQSFTFNAVDQITFPTLMTFTTTITNFTATTLRKQSTPFNNGLAGLITSSIDNSTSLAVIAGWLYDIKTQDSTYYSQLMTRLVSIDSFVNSINTWTQSIYNKVANIDTNTTTILNELQTYINFMEGYIPYLQNINTNTLNTYNQLVTIYNYIKNRPTIKTEFQNIHMYTNAAGNHYLYSGTYSENRKSIVLKKEQNIEYIYLNNLYSINNNYTTIAYFEEKELPTGDYSGRRIYPTRIITLPYGTQYYTIDFKYNENLCLINGIELANTNNSNFLAYIGDGYTYSALMYYIENMMNMNQQQSEAVEELESEYNSKDENSSQLLNGLGSLNLPEVNQGDFDILSNVDSTSKINFFGLLGLITHNNLVTTILLIIITGAIVGYALYGKK